VRRLRAAVNPERWTKTGRKRPDRQATGSAWFVRLSFFFPLVTRS
jgi:hypothetical protein